MKNIANKVQTKRFMYGSLVIFLVLLIDAFQLRAFCNNDWFLIMIPFSLPVIGIGAVLQWNYDFRLASFKEKREMAIALRTKEEI